MQINVFQRIYRLKIQNCRLYYHHIYLKTKKNLPFLNEFPEFSFVAMSLLSQKFINTPIAMKLKKNIVPKYFIFTVFIGQKITISCFWWFEGILSCIHINLWSHKYIQNIQIFGHFLSENGVWQLKFVLLEWIYHPRTHIT